MIRLDRGASLSDGMLRKVTLEKSQPHRLMLVLMITGSICLLLLLFRDKSIELPYVTVLSRSGLTADWDGPPSWSPDKKFIMVWRKPFRDSKTLILKAAELSQVCTINAVGPDSWSPDSTLVAIESEGVAIYNPTSGQELQRTDAQAPIDIAWSPNSKRLAIADRYRLRILDIASKTECKLDSSRTPDWRLLIWSPDGKLLAASSTCESNEFQQERQVSIKIFDATTAESKRSLDVSSWVGSIGWSPDQRFFLYSIPGEIRILSNKFEPLSAIATEDPYAVKFDWAPTADRLSFSDNDQIRIFRSEDMTEVLKIKAKSNRHFVYEWSPDGRYLLINGHGTLAICESGTGAYLGYKNWENIGKSVWAPDQQAIAVSMQDEVELVTLRQPLDNSLGPFFAGGTGSPPWSNNPRVTNLDDCFKAFDEELNSLERARFMLTPEDNVHEFGGGSCVSDNLMANIYGRWDDCELVKFFHRNGIDDERDMTGIILQSYWRHLHKRPINLEKQIRDHIWAWRMQDPVITIDRKLSPEILHFQANDKRGGTWSIGSVKAKMKIVTFADTDEVQTAQQLQCLKELRSRHPSSDLAFFVFVVAPEDLTRERWPTMKFKVVPSGGEAPKRDIAEFFNAPGRGIYLADAPHKLCTDFIRFGDVPEFAPYGPPQTLIIEADDTVKLRLNGFNREWTRKTLDSQISKAGL